MSEGFRDMEEIGIPKRDTQKHRQIGTQLERGIHLKKDRCKKEEIWN